MLAQYALPARWGSPPSYLRTRSGSLINILRDSNERELFSDRAGAKSKDKVCKLYIHVEDSCSSQPGTIFRCKYINNRIRFPGGGIEKFFANSAQPRHRRYIGRFRQAHYPAHTQLTHSYRTPLGRKDPGLPRNVGCIDLHPECTIPGRCTPIIHTLRM